jgi:hypothetical protein
MTDAHQHRFAAAHLRAIDRLRQRLAAGLDQRRLIWRATPSKAGLGMASARPAREVGEAGHMRRVAGTGAYVLPRVSKAILT